MENALPWRKVFGDEEQSVGATQKPAGFTRLGGCFLVSAFRGYEFGYIQGAVVASEAGFLPFLALQGRSCSGKVAGNARRHDVRHLVDRPHVSPRRQPLVRTEHGMASQPCRRHGDERWRRATDQSGPSQRRQERTGVSAFRMSATVILDLAGGILVFGERA